MKKFLLSMMCAAAGLCASAATFTYSHTFASGEITTDAAEVELSGVKWSVPAATYAGFDNTKGVQIGSKNNPTTAYSFSTDAFNAVTVKSVIVNASIASSGTAVFSVKVGDTAFGTEVKPSTAAANYTFDGSASGELTISVNNTAKAFYVNSITVTYEGDVQIGEGGTEPEPEPVVTTEGEGTEEKPYTVTDVIALKSSKPEAAWVTGYIVGYYNNNTVTFSADNALNSNIAMAATADETDATKCVPVQLPSGNARTALNLKDNPGNLGKEAQVYGTLEDYFKVPGIKSVSKYNIDNGGETPEPEPIVTEGEGTDANPYTVADVIALNNTKSETAWVKGYIVGSAADKTADSFTTATGASASNTNIFVAGTATETDYTKCVPVQLPSGDVRNALSLQQHPENLGKELQIFGKLLAYFGMPGVKEATEYKIETGGVVPEPEPAHTYVTFEANRKDQNDNHWGTWLQDANEAVKGTYGSSTLCGTDDYTTNVVWEVTDGTAEGSHHVKNFVTGKYLVVLQNNNDQVSDEPIDIWFHNFTYEGKEGIQIGVSSTVNNDCIDQDNHDNLCGKWANDAGNLWFMSTLDATTPEEVEALFNQPEPVVTEGEGTEEKPYTVADVIALNNTKAETAWVTGYIVGSAPDKTADSFTTETGESASNTNIFVAGTATETDYTKCIPVQLPSGEIRAALNLKDNPGNLGKEVAVYGSLEKYFGMAGVKSVTNYKLEGEVAPTYDEVADIAEWLEEQPAEYTTITGAVTVVYQNGLDLFVQDETGSLFVYGNLGTQTFSNGDVLTGITGKYSSYNNMVQLSPIASTFANPTEGTPVEPAAATLADVNGNNLAKYVTISDLTCTVEESNGKSVYTVTDGTDSVEIYNRYGIEGVMAGVDVKVTGFVYVYGTKMEIVPVEFSATDAITEISAESADTVIFDLQGRRVANPTASGLYIVNGQKTLIRK